MRSSSGAALSPGAREHARGGMHAVQFGAGEAGVGEPQQFTRAGADVEHAGGRQASDGRQCGAMHRAAEPLQRRVVVRPGASKRPTSG